MPEIRGPSQAVHVMGLISACGPYREDTAANEEDEKEKARLRQAEAMREADARKERKRKANERKAAQKAAANKAKEVQKSAAAATAAAPSLPEPKENVSGSSTLSTDCLVRFLMLKAASLADVRLRRMCRGSLSC